MELARISAKGQTTIPKRIRDGAGMREGDLLVFELELDRVVIRRVRKAEDMELAALQSTLSEWASAEDDEAWRDL